MRILVTGGCGYVGSVLVPKLLAAGHDVAVRDIQWFGNHLQPHPKLRVCKHDIREPLAFESDDVVIHLAAIANDPTGELDPKATWETNALATAQLAEAAYRCGAKQFIYASSGSVYGVSDAPQVTEETTLDPISDYNRTKMVAERCVLSYADKMAVQILRPATVCGYSPRMRLDVVVNMLAMQAMTTGQITVLGGVQMRPNIHIEDMTDLYLWMLDRPQLTGIWNAGFENLSVMEIAEKVEGYANCRISKRPSTDPRSYRMNSDKLLRAGFKPKRTVDDAIGDVIAHAAAGTLRDEDNCYNLKAMPRCLQSA
jgi:nucleoside-diphosphate-sugar epimerase